MMVFILLLLVCATQRVALISNTITVARDSTSYIAMAREMRIDFASGMKLTTYHPGYPILIYLTEPLVVDVFSAPSELPGVRRLRRWELAGQYVAFVFSIASLALLWRLTEKTFGFRAAAMAIVMVGMWRKWAVLGGEALSDSPTLFFELASIAAALKAVELLDGPWKKLILPALATGLAAGCGYWIRGEALAAAAAAMLLWALAALRRPARIRAALVAAAACISGLIVFVGPYMLIMKRLTTKKVLGEGVEDALAQQLDPVVRIVIKQYSQAIGPVMCVLVGLWLLWGLWMLLKGRSARQTASAAVLAPRGPLMAYAGILTLISLPVLVLHYRNTTFMSYRYFLLVSAVTLPAGAAMAVWIIDRAAGWICPKRRGVFFALAATGFLVGFLYHSARPLHDGSLFYRDVGFQVAEMSDRSGLPVVTDSRLIHHYSMSDEPVLKFRRLSEDYLSRFLAEYSGRELLLAISGEGLAKVGHLPGTAGFALIETVSDEADPSERILLYRVNVP